MQAQQDAIEQLRGDLKDAMRLVRASTLSVDYQHLTARLALGVIGYANVRPAVKLAD